MLEEKTRLYGRNVRCASNWAARALRAERGSLDFRSFCSCKPLVLVSICFELLRKIVMHCSSLWGKIFTQKSPVDHGKIFLNVYVCRPWSTCTTRCGKFGHSLQVALLMRWFKPWNIFRAWYLFHLSRIIDPLHISNYWPTNLICIFHDLDNDHTKKLLTI